MQENRSGNASLASSSQPQALLASQPHLSIWPTLLKNRTLPLLKILHIPVPNTSEHYIVVAADSGGTLKSAYEENICYT
jgi:hypothetical protein